MYIAENGGTDQQICLSFCFKYTATDTVETFYVKPNFKIYI